MPHTSQCFIDEIHDLGGSFRPSKFKKLLPYMARVAMNDSLRDPSKELMDHDSFVVLGNRVECFLDDMASEGVHRKVESISTDSFGNLNHLLGCTVLKAALNQEIAESIDHKRICLRDDSFNDLVLLLRSADFELLL